MMNNTKDKIIYHAIILFGTYGYQNVSMRQIAAAIGLNSSSLYNHFDSKEKILDAAIEKYYEIFSSYHPAFDDLRKMAPDLTAREVIEKFCFVYRPDDILIMLHLLRIQFAEQFNNEKIRTLVFDTLLDGRMKDMADLFGYLMELGKIPPGNPAALAQIWTSTMGIAALRAAHNTDTPQADLEQFGDITDFMINLICGEEEKGKSEMPGENFAVLQ